MHQLSHIHLESFQIHPGGTLASLGGSKQTNQSNSLLCRNAVFMSIDLHTYWFDAIMAKAICRPSLDHVRESFLILSGFTDFVVIKIFISVNLSCIYPELALVRYLGVNSIFNPALEFSFFFFFFFCSFQVMIRERNHYVFLVTKGVFIITYFTCFPF